MLAATFTVLVKTNSCDELEELLAFGERILSVFCEFPSNPLLKSPDLKRLSRLSEEYNFMVVVDKTIGNFCDAGGTRVADMVVSSLTRSFRVTATSWVEGRINYGMCQLIH